MAIFDYSPLWKTMQEKGVSQYQLLKNGIDNKTLDSLKKNKNIFLILVYVVVKKRKIWLFGEYNIKK